MVPLSPREAEAQRWVIGSTGCPRSTSAPSNERWGHAVKTSSYFGRENGELKWIQLLICHEWSMITWCINWWGNISMINYHNIANISILAWSIPKNGRFSNQFGMINWEIDPFLAWSIPKNDKPHGFPLTSLGEPARPSPFSTASRPRCVG